MKKIFAISLFIVTSISVAIAQNSTDEQEILKLNAEYERAQLNRDAEFFERALADDYIASYETGTTENKAEYLEVIRKERQQPTYKLISMKSEDLKIKLMGNAAVLTGTWLITTGPILDNTAEPQAGKGLYTSVFEKRDGRWLIVAEHISVAPRDRKLMEQRVSQAGREYNDLTKSLKSGRNYSESEKSGDVAALGLFLADEYTSTETNGEISTKTEDLESYKTNRIKLGSAEILEQKVRVIGNNAAVETGLVRHRGSNNGKAFEITKRYTRTLVLRDWRWQIIADHNSAVDQ